MESHHSAHGTSQFTQFDLSAAVDETKVDTSQLSYDLSGALLEPTEKEYPSYFVTGSSLGGNVLGFNNYVRRLESYSLHQGMVSIQRSRVEFVELRAQLETFLPSDVTFGYNFEMTLAQYESDGTPTRLEPRVDLDLYDSKNKPITVLSSHPGYFVCGNTKMSEVNM